MHIPAVLNKQTMLLLKIKNEDLTNGFNNFFVTIGENIFNNFETNKMDHHKYFCIKNNPNSLFLESITKEEIKK